MEMSQGNSVHNYLKQKCRFLFLQNWRTEGQNSSFLGAVVTSGRGEGVGKGCKGMNIVQILCTPVETISGLGGVGDKGEWWWGDFKRDIFDIL
jgi:hypothetical protein